MGIFERDLERFRKGEIDCKPFDPTEVPVLGDCRKDGVNYKVWDGSGWVSLAESSGGQVAYLVTSDMLPKVAPWWKRLVGQLRRFCRQLKASAESFYSNPLGAPHDEQPVTVRVKQNKLPGQD